jgi:hypothetical protein
MIRWVCDNCGAVFRGSHERELACPNCGLVGAPIEDDDLLNHDGAEDWRDNAEREWDDDDYAADQMLDDHEEQP